MVNPSDQAQQLSPESQTVFIDTPADVTFSAYGPEEVFLQWVGPNRIHKKRTREYYSTIATIVFLLSVLAFIANQIFLIPLIISFAFLSYVLAAVPPTDMQCQITTYGIRMGRKLYVWEALGRFWTTERFNMTVLHVEYNDPIFRRISLVLTPDIREEVLLLISAVLPNEMPEPSFIEKAGAWLQKNFPLERE